MLTEEQKRLVEENHNLIYWYCHKYNLDIEEYYGLFAIELCRAVQLYDPTKSKIATYIIKAFWNKHVNWEKSKKRNKRKANEDIISIDQDYGAEGEEAKLSDFLTNGKSIEDEIIMIPLSECGLNDKLMSVVRLRLENPNLTQREIGDILGIGQVQAGRRLKQAEQKIKEAWCID